MEGERPNASRGQAAIASSSTQVSRNDSSPANSRLFQRDDSSSSSNEDPHVRMQERIGYGLDESAVTRSANDDFDDEEREVVVTDDPGNGAPIGDEEKRARDASPSRSISLRRKILHFSPSWFSVTMGTGVIVPLFNLLGLIWGTEQYSPYFRSFIRWPALVFLILDIIIFIAFSTVFISRYILFPQVFSVTIKHPQQSMFLGTIPMGLSVITSGTCLLGTTEFHLGLWPTFVSVGLYFVVYILTVVVTMGVPWTVMIFQKEHRFEGTTAALLLPIVPAVITAATGSVIAELLVEDHPTLAFTLMTMAYMSLGIGIPLAMMVLVLYLQRLILFKAPPREVIVSVFLPLGPCGQGGEAFLHLGKVAMTLFPVISTLPNSGVSQLTFSVGQAMYGGGLIAAMLLFALGIWWAVIAVSTLLYELKRGSLKFNMGFWSFTFPIGSLAICTGRLAIELDSLTLKIVYTVFAAAIFCLWVFVAIPTAKGFVSGKLIHAPCIAALPLDPLQEHEMKREQRRQRRRSNGGDVEKA